MSLFHIFRKIVPTTIDMEYLRKYHKDLQLISEKVDSVKEIPDAWKDILTGAKTAVRVENCLAMWEKHVASELSNTIKYLRENLIDVGLIQYGSHYSLLYSIKAVNGDILYYEGGNPQDAVPGMPEALKVQWKQMPENVVRFYEGLHNGFYYYASESMGLLPTQDIGYLVEENWGILEELTEPLEIDLQNTFGLFSSGAGGYVALDVSDKNHVQAVLWFTAKQPNYHVDFWDVVDEWIVIGMGQEEKTRHTDRQAGTLRRL